MLSWAKKWLKTMEAEEVPAVRDVETLRIAAMNEVKAFDTYLSVPRLKVSKDEFVLLLKAHEIDFKLGAYRLASAPVPTFSGCIVEIDE